MSRASSARRLAAALGGLALGCTLGCGATLRTLPVGDPAVFQGIRVHTLASYVVTREVVTAKCSPRIVEAIEHLPLGPAYDLRVEPGWFAASQFSVSLTDAGLLRQVTLNTDPQLDETIHAAAALTERVAGAAALVALPGCGDVVRESIVEVRPLRVAE